MCPGIVKGELCFTTRTCFYGLKNEVCLSAGALCKAFGWCCLQVVSFNELRFVSS